MDVHGRDVRTYLTKAGRAPYDEWLHELQDARTRATIRARINRVRLGNFEIARQLEMGFLSFGLTMDQGIESILHKKGSEVVILLCGGDKSSQRRDIEKAKAYWADYRSRSDA